VAGFIGRNYCGVRSVALRVSSVKDVFERAIVAGGIPIRFPTVLEDRYGRFEECSIKLYDENEIVFMCRDDYSGVFKPGYREVAGYEQSAQALLTGIDHIASELRINEVGYWTNYVTRTIGTSLVQNIKRGTDNNTGMIMNISQSPDKNLTLVMAEPESYGGSSKVQRNIDLFGPGIHHLAFSTGDLMSTVQSFKERGVEFVDIPSSYYTLLRTSEDMQGIDVDRLEELGVLVDKENGRYLLQKFIKPISDRPFFLYELVQRMSGYEGFALRNINILKRAEEMEIMKVQ
jgi:4-hydroxyphenylpyruvate dioxygenase